MDDRVKFRLYRMSVWCGVVVLVAFTVAFTVVGSLTPPISPTASAEQVTDFLTEHRSGVLWAVVIMGVFAPLFYPFAVVTSLQMRRIEGGWGLLSMVQLTTAVVAPTGWLYPLAVLATVTYRPGRDPQLVLLLSDQFWLTYVGIAAIFVVNVAVIGVSALVDRRPEPVFPRWFGYFNFVVALALLPGVFVYVSSSGPFAWDGLFAMMLPAVAFVVWKVLMIVYLLRAVRSEEREARRDPESLPAAV
ncbi:hypothetical protein [Actinophytocola oryzae]|uniref:Uncharacterized protein n=1 Tax=Actinophytocola oryzae TaxID=502181 RepID=A0A4R7W1V7_9PSEU|nr:hypothetical protein [Actinophytocola oryzae]TDV55988.1 hypothetical protein CLV71_10249 [Actinophytocola oryzae]